MSTQRKLAVAASVLFGALLVFSVFIMPGLVKNAICDTIHRATGRAVTIGRVVINPFTLSVRATEIVIQEKSGVPFLSCAGFRISLSPSSLYTRILTFASITLESPSLSITRTAPDRYSFSDIIEHYQSLIKPVSDGEYIIAINSAAVTGGQVHFRDAVPEGGFTGSLNDIDLALKNITTAADTAAGYDLSLLVNNEAPLSSEGSFTLSPLALKTSTEAEGLNLHKGWPYLAKYLTAPLNGIMDLSGEVSFSTAAGLIAENGRVIIRNLATRYGTNEGVNIPSLSAGGASYTQKDNRLVVAEVKLSKGVISLSRETDGQISFLSLFAPHHNPPERKKRSAATHKVDLPKAVPVPVSGTAKMFSYQLKQLQADQLELFFIDKSRSPKTSFSLHDTSIVLKNLNGPDRAPSQLMFSTIFGTQTPLKGSGIVTPLPFSYTGTINVQHLPIKDFTGYFPENVNIKVVNGSLDAALNVDITVRDGTPFGTFKGNGGVRSFSGIDTISGESLLAWESLQLDEFHGSLEPFILDVRKIALNGVYSRIIVNKDGTLNLQHLVRKTLPTVINRPVARKKTEKNNHITVGAVTIQDGTLAFSDYHLLQQFTTTFHKLGGRISGLSSDESSLADVDLRGNLESQSPLKITGKINPLRKDLFVDLTVSFHDIELSPVSPYSGSYLGYTIEKGKLYLDLKYHIEKNILTSDNKIFVDQFSFGSKVESDMATSLPVLLGLALLKDHRGEIHLDVPVTGRTDNPELNVWKLVRQSISNLLVKAVTSPLALLSSMFGSDEDFSVITFAPGTSLIIPREELKLDNLARALLERPALKMELTGYVDREKDSEGYRSELLTRKVTQEKLLTLRAGDGAKADGQNNATLVTSNDYDRYLAAVYRKETFPKPRTALGRIKDLPPDEMKKLIIVSTVVGEHELQALARERTMAVIHHLIQKGKVPAERLFQNEDDVYKAPEEKSLSRSRVELHAIVQ